MLHSNTPTMIKALNNTEMSGMLKTRTAAQLRIWIKSYLSTSVGKHVILFLYGAGPRHLAYAKFTKDLESVLKRGGDVTLVTVEGLEITMRPYLTQDKIAELRTLYNKYPNFKIKYRHRMKTPHPLHKFNKELVLTAVGSNVKILSSNRFGKGDSLDKVMARAAIRDEAHVNAREKAKLSKELA